MEKTVTIPPGFFLKHVKNVYSDFTTALTRELVQNSIDAGATEIRLNFSDSGYSCWDNGYGMSKQRMEEAMLTMGGSVKSEGSVGGFGEAKVLLLFAMKSFTISSNGIMATGQQLQYSWSEVKNTEGTLITGEFGYDSGFYGHSTSEVAKRFISKCETKTKIYVNDELIRQPKNSVFVGMVDKFGVIRKRKSEESCGSIWVRHHGVFMFERYVGTTKDQFSLDLCDTVGMLSSSRDGFRKYSASSKFDTLIQELMIEKKVKPKPSCPRIFFGKNGKLSTVKESPICTVDIPGSAPENSVRFSTLEKSEPGNTDLGSMGKMRNLVDDIIDKKSCNDFLVVPGADDKIPRKLRPGNMSRKHEELALLWKALIIKCMEINDISEVFSIGFTLDPKAAATRFVTENNGTFYLINPFSSLFQGSLRQKFWSMLVACTHELAHIDISWHDQEFVQSQERLLTKVLNTGISPNKLISAAKKDRL